MDGDYSVHNAKFAFKTFSLKENDMQLFLFFIGYFYNHKVSEKKNGIDMSTLKIMLYNVKIEN